MNSNPNDNSNNNRIKSGNASSSIADGGSGIVISDEQDKRKIELKFKLDKLKEMCECPQMFRLYLGNYFCELRNEVEVNFFSFFLLLSSLTQ